MATQYDLPNMNLKLVCTLMRKVNGSNDNFCKGPRTCEVCKFADVCKNCYILLFTLRRNKVPAKNSKS